MKDYPKRLWISPQLKMLSTSLIKLKVTMKSLGEILTEWLIEKHVSKMM